MRRIPGLLGMLSLLAVLVVAPVAPVAAESVPVTAPAGEPQAAREQVGREQVGVVEQVDTVLGYLDDLRTVTFHYPGAAYVKVHLYRMLLLPGDYVTVADPERTEVHRYEAASLLGLGSAQWAMSVTGDTAVVELHTPGWDPLGARASLARLGVTVDKVARGFAPGEAPAAEPVRTGREESICGSNDSRDAVCYRASHPEIYERTKAVARLLINGTQMCTAFRVGPGNRLLTNNHCIDSTRQARRTEVWFNYQCAECGGWATFRPTKVWGDELLATHRVLDFTLFTVDDFAAVQRYGFLELDPRQVAAGEEIYIPQHPAGAPNRVALRSDRDVGGNCVVGNPYAHGYGWYTDMAYFCDTQGGSSGSPVLSRDTHKVIALHHFGGCPNSGVRMDLIHPHIAGLLL